MSLTNTQLETLQAKVDLLKQDAKAEADAETNLSVAHQDLAAAQAAVDSDTLALTMASATVAQTESDLLAFVQSL